MGRYPNGLTNKYVEVMKQMRAPPGSDLKKLPYPLMLKDRVKDRGSEIEPRNCMSEINMVFQVSFGSCVGSGCNDGSD